MPGLYFDFSFPVELRNLLQSLVRQKEVEQSTDSSVVVDTKGREWLSQPRLGTDSTVEAININFKIPLSVSEISVEVPRKSSKVEFWYRDRSNNWRQILDSHRLPVEFTLSHSEGDSWYTYKTSVYPLVAKSVQMRITRVDDGMGNPRPYSVGARNLLIKRNIYERGQGVHPLEEEQDPLGNVVTKHIKDWDAGRAIDDNAVTFWKSSPQPDPSAVVSMYLDVRDSSGGEVLVDKLYIDPVYKGQMLNIYYSTDDSTTSRRISPLSLLPTSDVNTEWQRGVGLVDLNATAPSLYQLNSKWGVSRNEPMWVGIQWSPDFASNVGPSRDPVLFRATNSSLTVPIFRYSSGDQAFVLTLQGPSSNLSWTAPVTNAFRANDDLRIAVGWLFVEDGVRVVIKAVNENGVTVASLDQTASFPEGNRVSFDNVSLEGFRGIVKSLIIKFGDVTEEYEDFLHLPQLFVSPDPTLPNEDGIYPPSSLDNAVFAVDWTTSQFGIGGRSETEYEGKVWSPVWRDFVVEKGFLYFPKPVSTKYLKLELTNLTEEPYPVYEPGIDVQYKVFPIEVQQASSRGPRLNLGQGVGGLFGFANLNGVKSVNWFSPSSVFGAAEQIFGRTYEPVQIAVGQSYVTRSIPNTYDSPITQTNSLELASNLLNRRSLLNPYVLAQNVNYTTIKGEGLLKIAPYVNVPWEEIYKANPGAIETSPQAGALAVRGADWWIFPGQTLKIPASVMEGLTNTSTVVEMKATLEKRVRFTSNSVHEYAIRTVRRDVSLAYFAGFREVTPYTSSYIAEEDRDSFDFLTYNTPPWATQGLTKLESNVMALTDSSTPGYAAFSFTTTSNFSKLSFNFRDSGFLHSDTMWQDDGLELSSKTHVKDFDKSAWSDSFSSWTDTSTDWGAPRGLVSVTLDENRLYQGKRVLKFSRLPGAGEAGIEVLQSLNYSTLEGLARIRATLYKPTQNDNEVIVRLVHVASSSVIYETSVDVGSGQWVDFTSPLFIVPSTSDPNYRVEMVTRGDQQDEVYLNDLYTETSYIRYFIAEGSSVPSDTSQLKDITELRDKKNAAYIFQNPVRSATVYVTLSSDRQFLYGVTITPSYLQ